MRTIIIGDGLSRDVLSPELPFRESRRSVGRAEIERLLGRGKSFGEGPLPAFLRQAVAAREDGVDLVLLGEPGGFVEPLEDAAGGAAVIVETGGALPGVELLAHLETRTARGPPPGRP